MSGRKLFVVVTAAVFCGLMLFGAFWGFGLWAASDAITERGRSRAEEQSRDVVLRNKRAALKALDEHLATHPQSSLRADRDALAEEIRAMESKR